MDYQSTRQAAKTLGIRPDALARAVWIGRLDPPEKSPSGDFLWTQQDIDRASWVLLHRSYISHGEQNKDGPVHIGDILPGVLGDIRQRMEQHRDGK